MRLIQTCGVLQIQFAYTLLTLLPAVLALASAWFHLVCLPPTCQPVWRSADSSAHHWQALATLAVAASVYNGFYATDYVFEPPKPPKLKQEGLLKSKAASSPSA